jgi:hypothetical protein
MTEERALQLRYLQGVNCFAYTPTLAVAGLLGATARRGATYTCAGGGSLPCCPSAYSIPGMGAGAGLSCLFWVPGAMVTRQTYSVDEAYQNLSPSPDNEVPLLC